jgi:hypothetical protein
MGGWGLLIIVYGVRMMFSELTVWGERAKFFIEVFWYYEF